MKSDWLRALKLSTTTTVLCVAITGAAFLPREIARLIARPEIRALKCSPAADGKLAVSLIGVIRGGDVDRSRSMSIIAHDLSQDPPAIRHLLRSGANPTIFAVDFPGNRLFLGDMSGSVTIAGLQPTDQRWQLLGHGLQGSLRGMACTADANSLIFLDEVGLYAWNITDRDAPGHPRWSHVDRAIGCFVLTPDSRGIICSRTSAEASSIFELSIETGEIEDLHVDIDRPLKRLIVSADGKYLLGAAVHGEAVLLQRDATDRAWQPVTIPGLCTNGMQVGCFSSDVRVLITSRPDGRRLLAWDLLDKELLKEFDRLPFMVSGCESLEGGQFVSSGENDSLLIWDLQSSFPVRQISLGP